MIALPLAMLLCANPAPASIAPVAVMPFKDLSGDAKLAWLSVGIAETMTVDLRKGSRLQVVERDQLNHALSELKLQGLRPTDESSAAKLGKMVSARTVVVGSYQESNQELRIVARFVDVETGVVRGAAKVTGSDDDVFALQDAIVVKLAGTAFGDAVKRHKAAPKKRFAAYKLYAMSFAVMSDASRAQLLGQALKEDPGFSYAADDLLDLQDRLKRLSAANEVIVTKQIAGYRAITTDASQAPAKRLTAAMQLIGEELADRRWHAALRDTAWIIGSDLPDNDSFRIRQFAQFQRINLYQELKEPGLAMQVAETFLKLYPGSPYFPAAEAVLAYLASHRAAELENERTVDAALTLATDRVDAERVRIFAPRPNQLFEWAQAPCDVLREKDQYAREAACLQDVLEHRVSTDPSLDMRYTFDRLMLIRSAADAGEFELARRTAEQFQKDDPEAALRYSVNLTYLSLPTD